MSIEALILGKLHARPECRTSKAGREYATCKVRVSVEGETVFVNAIAFDAAACAALLSLDAGDALALAGTLKPSAWIDKEGAARPNLNLVVSRLLTPYEAKRKRDAAQSSAPASKPARDEFGSDDEWLGVERG